MTDEHLWYLNRDVAERNLIGTVIKAFEKGALKVVAMDMRRVFPDLIAKHYPDSMAETLGRKSERAGEKIDNYVEQGMAGAAVDPELI